METPYIVAGIEGTEALRAVKPQESLAITAVRTGIVNSYDHAKGRAHTLRVRAGEAAFRSASVPFQKAPIGSLPPQFRSLIVVSDFAVDWAIYYLQFFSRMIRIVGRSETRSYCSLRRTMIGLPRGWTRRAMLVFGKVPYSEQSLQSVATGLRRRSAGLV